MTGQRPPPIAGSSHQNRPLSSTAVRRDRHCRRSHAGTNAATGTRWSPLYAGTVHSFQGSFRLGSWPGARALPRQVVGAVAATSPARGILLQSAVQSLSTCSQHGQLIALPFRAQETPLQPSVAAASANLSSRANSLIAVVLRVGKMISQVPVRAPKHVRSQRAHRSSFRRSARPPTLRCLCPPPGRVESQRCSTRTYRCTQLTALEPSGHRHRQ
ncbi:hypothetical protein GGI35DRAFT_341969 [Trichoderma velutinum]